jgi:predicted DCC family thiol-disulfide oxidoreductase YuxK
MPRRPAPAAPDIVFYDGHCGLCHGAVRFLLPRDRAGALFRFAPLQGDELVRRVPPGRREELPDSIVVLEAAGALHVRSDAVLHLLERLGGGWGFLARVGRAVPRGLRDAAYDGVARVRGHLFARPPDRCPVVPAELRSRFLD